MKFLKTAVVLLSVLQPLSVYAAVVGRTDIVDNVQMESSTRVGYENIMYVMQSAPWVGSTICPTGWVYFNAKENPHFVATVLAARVSKEPLKVYVDDSLVKVGVACQVINMTL